MTIQKTNMDVEKEMRKSLPPNELRELRRRRRRAKDEYYRNSKQHAPMSPMTNIPNNIHAFLSASLLYIFKMSDHKKGDCRGRIVSHFNAGKEAQENILLYSIIKTAYPERETFRDLTYSAAISINAIVAQTIGLGKMFDILHWFFIIDGITDLIESDPGGP